MGVLKDKEWCLAARASIPEPATVNPATNQCLEVAWAKSAAGAVVEVNKCSEWPSEHWLLDAYVEHIVSGLNTDNCLGHVEYVEGQKSEVWYAPLQNGDIAVVLLNRG